MIKKLVLIFILTSSSFVFAKGSEGIYSCDVSKKHSGTLEETKDMVLLELKKNKATIETIWSPNKGSNLLFTSKYSRNKNTITFSEIYDEKGKKQQIDSISGKITKQGFGFSLGKVAGKLTSVNNNTALFISNCIKKQYSDISTFDIKGIKFNSTYDSIKNDFPCTLSKESELFNGLDAYSCSDINSTYLVGFSKNKKLASLQRLINSKAMNKVNFDVMKRKIIKKYGSPTEELTYEHKEGSGGFSTYICWGSCKIVNGNVIMVYPSTLVKGKGLVVNYIESKDGSNLSFHFTDHLIQKAGDIEL